MPTYAFMCERCKKSLDLVLTVGATRGASGVGREPSGGRGSRCHKIGLRSLLPAGDRRIPAMTHVHPKAIPNWCPQVNPDEPWPARCVKEKIAADGKRHRCQKKSRCADWV